MLGLYFLMNVGDVNSGPLAFAVSTVSIEPCPQLLGCFSLAEPDKRLLYVC